MTIYMIKRLHDIIQGPAMRHAANDGMLHQKCPRSICRRTRDCHGLDDDRACMVHWSEANWASYAAMYSFAAAHFGDDLKFCEPPRTSKPKRPKPVIPDSISANLAACEQALMSLR
jgi:hypothetical protein